MGHNLPMPPAPAKPNEQPIQRWRAPLALRAESLVVAALGVTIALVFLPLWFAIPVAVALAAVYGGVAVAGSSVTVDRGHGILVFRMGVIVRRIRLSDITAVLVDQAKISIARAAGGEISVTVWGNSPLDRWLRVPAEATDIGHAIAGAVALAEDAWGGEDQRGRAGASAAGQAANRTAGAAASARSRSTLSAALLGGTGVIAVVAALLIRVHWHNPAMTVLAVILALACGVLGLLYLLVALWILLTGSAARTTADQARADQAGADRAGADQARADRSGAAV
jgi:hypothetical protein